VQPVESAVFWIAAVSAVLSGIGVVSARSSIYSALSLIVTLAQLAILYLLLNAQFIAAAQILIYAGAVMVLFLFVITLLGVRDYPFMGQHLPFQRPLSIIFAGLLLLGVVFFVAQSSNAITGTPGTFNAQLSHGNVEAFGTQLFSTFVFPFELTTMILIVAMVGAVAVGRRRGNTGRTDV
jgi:NADH-quinone oxidoreductase subunit J